MPNKPAAAKALRQTKKHTERNLAKKKKIKELTKSTLQAIGSGATNTSDLLRQTFKVLDKAAKTNTIHPNKANRLKSRLHRKLNAATVVKPA